MRFDVMTLFPDMIRTVTESSIIGRAAKSGIIEININPIKTKSL